MRSIRSLSSIVIAVAAFTHGVVAAAPRAVRVGIRLERPATAASRYAPAMIAEADAIWRQYGVTIALNEQSAGCDVQLTLTFAPAAKTSGARRQNAPGLGAIWFNDSGMPSRSLTIDRDNVAAAVREAGMNGRSVDGFPPAVADQMISRGLGRVLAHEIGHFLLASPAHSTSGLMRPAFDGRILGGFDRIAFRLDASALPRLQARLARLEALEGPVAAASDETP